MTRIPVMFVALLIVTAPLTAAAGGVSPVSGETADATQVQEEDVPENISWILAGEDATSGTADPDPDLGSALTMGDTEFENRIELGSIEAQYESLESPDEKEALLDETLDGIEGQIQVLHERERDLADQYHSGEVDQRTVLREVVEISNEAATLRAATTDIERLSQSEPGVSVSVRNVRGELTRFDSPLRIKLSEATFGIEDTGTVQVSAVENTLVLSDFDDGVYYREAVQFDRYKPNEPSTFESLTELEDRGPELYPWIYSNSLFEFEWGISGYVSLVGLSLDHPRGETLSYIDTTTQDVVMEYHTLDVNSLPTTATVSRSNENATISSHRVYDGGPVWVSVTEPDTGDPLDATVSIEGHEVQTGEDGTTWVVAPDGDVEVTATTAEGEVSITVREPNS